MVTRSRLKRTGASPARKTRLPRTEALLERIPKPEVAHIKLLKVDKVVTPHPYCITPKHLETGRMYLDKDAIREAEEKYGAVCDICRARVRKGLQDGILTIDEHKQQTVLFLEIAKEEAKENLNDVAGLNKYLLKIKPVLTELKIDGVAFVKGE